MPTTTIHLDTNFLIGSLAAGSAQDTALRRWLEEGRRLAISAVAWTEFLCGPLSANVTELAARLVSEVVPLDERDAETAAALFNDTGRRRGSLVDCLIAATAIRHDAPLAAADTNDFARFAALGLELAT